MASKQKDWHVEEFSSETDCTTQDHEPDAEIKSGTESSSTLNLLQAIGGRYIMKNKGQYKTWRHRIELKLKAHGLYELITEPEGSDIWGDERQRKINDAKAQSMIISHLHDSYVAHLLGVNTARAMMERIQDLFERKSAIAPLDALKRLINLKYHENASIQNHLSRFEQLVRELETFS